MAREHICSIERMLDAQQDKSYGGQTFSIGRSKDLRENKKILRLPSKSRPEGFYSLETNCSAGFPLTEKWIEQALENVPHLILDRSIQGTF